MATGQVITNDLVRKKWMREGLIQAASKSFWAPYSGTTKDSIVYQTNNSAAADGHTVVFDFDGNLSGKPVTGTTPAYGTGETKRKFSDKITVERFRYAVGNGDKFDGKNIGDLSITEHSDSRTKLADLWVRAKDQMIFDVAQQGASHIIDVGTTFNFDTFLDIENIIKTGAGYTTGAKRRPLDPFMTQDGNPIWLMAVDSATKTALLKSTGAQSMLQTADVRGNNNRLISGVIGKVGNFLVVEAGTFFGDTTGVTATTSTTLLDGSGRAQPALTGVEIAGLRQRIVDVSTNKIYWSGMTPPTLATGDKTISRSVILGAGAVQLAFGKMPDYKFQESTDFGITSESALEVWCAAKKTTLVLENSDYNEAKVAGIDFGAVAVDFTVKVEA